MRRSMLLCAAAAAFAVSQYATALPVTRVLMEDEVDISFHWGTFGFAGAMGTGTAAPGGHDGTSPVGTGFSAHLQMTNPPFFGVDNYLFEEQINANERAGLDLAAIPDGTTTIGRFWYKFARVPGWNGTGAAAVNPTMINLSYRYFDDGDADPVEPGVQSGNREVIRNSANQELIADGQWHQAIVPMNLKTAAERAATVAAGGLNDPDLLTVYLIELDMNPATYNGQPSANPANPWDFMIDHVEVEFIPEPATFGLVLPALAGLLARRRA